MNKEKLYQRVNEAEFFHNDKEAVTEIRFMIELATNESELREAEHAVGLYEDEAYKDYPQD